MVTPLQEVVSAVCSESTVERPRKGLARITIRAWLPLWSVETPVTQFFVVEGPEEALIQSFGELAAIDNVWDRHKCACLLCSTAGGEYCSTFRDLRAAYSTQWNKIFRNPSTSP